MTSSDFFKQCTDDGTCYQRVNPIRIGSDSQDDILKQDMTFHCHITNMNQLEQSDYSDCKIGEKNTMVADHVNLQYENYIYVCTSMNSRYNKKDHKYNCTYNYDGNNDCWYNYDSSHTYGLQSQDAISCSL